MTRIYLVRHGETEGNVAGIWHGWTGTSLTPRGREQAQALGLAVFKDLRLASCYSSSSDRALQTARILTQLEIFPHDDLREIGLGDFEGLTDAEAKSIAPEAIELFFARPSQFQPVGNGETFFQLQERARRIIETIANNHGGETVLAVTHGCFLKVVWTFLTNTPIDEIWKTAPDFDNCAVLIVERHPSGWSIV